MEKAISLQNITKDFPGVRSLHQVNFEVERGHIHGLIGANGAGKSTTMNILTGLLKPSEGIVKILGKKLEHRWPPQLVGYLPENLPLYPDMFVDEFLRFSGHLYGLSGRDLEKRIDNVLERFLLTDYRRRIIRNLSKGTKQKVGLCMVLLYEPQILVLDEPTSGLDPLATIEIRQLLAELKGKHTILLSSHLLHEVTLTCSEVSLIHQGRMLFTGPLTELENQIPPDLREDIVTAEVSFCPPEILDELRALKFVKRVQVTQMQEKKMKVQVFTRQTKNVTPQLGELFIKNGVDLHSLVREEMNLEQYYLHLTKGKAKVAEFFQEGERA